MRGCRTARLGLLALVLAASSGCAHHREANRDAALRSVLERVTLPATLEEVKGRIEALPRASWSPEVGPCAGCLEASLCRGAHCGFWIRFAEEEVRLEVREAEAGGVRLAFLSGSNAAAAELGLGLWDAVDPSSLELERQRLEASLERGDAAETVGFSTRLAPLVGLFMSGGTGHLGGALRVGVHRWHGPRWLTAYALEYQGGILGLFTPNPRGGHFLLPTFLLEFSRWTELTDRARGAPGMMGYALAAPVFFVGDGPVGFGWKLGLGFGSQPSIAPYSGRFFAELLYQHVHTPGFGGMGSFGCALGYGF